MSGYSRELTKKKLQDVHPGKRVIYDGNVYEVTMKNGVKSLKQESGGGEVIKPEEHNIYVKELQWDMF